MNNIARKSSFIAGLSRLAIQWPGVSRGVVSACEQLIDSFVSWVYDHSQSSGTKLKNSDISMCSVSSLDGLLCVHFSVSRIRDEN
jgi:hypothetical protein